MKLLITLVGSNPLPVYVSIEALLKFGHAFDRILFVFSSGTKCYTDYVIKALQSKGDHGNGYEYCDLGQDQRNSTEICNKVRTTLQNLGNNITLIHYNYTGGTKTMALNTYRAILEYVRCMNGITLELSDLNPETHKLSILEESSARQIPKNGNLLEHIKCNLDEIVALHGLSEKKDGLRKLPASPFLGMDTPQVYYQFVQALYDDYKLLSGYHDKWCLYRNHKNKVYNQLSKLGLSDFPSLTKELDIPGQVPLLAKFGSTPEWKENLYDFCQFVDGKWLEQYVFETLNDTMKAHTINCDDIRMGYEVKLSGQRKSELDVIVIKGYQLTLISCTTSSSIGLVKHKAFEAVYRARQLGGEQANIIVVSFLYNNSITGIDRSNENNLECLKADLQAFELDKNVTLIGRDNLMKSVDSSRIADPAVKTLSDCLLSVLKLEGGLYDTSHI